MKTIFKKNKLILVPASNTELEELTSWKNEHEHHHFVMKKNEGIGMFLESLGDPRLDQPINVTSKHPSPSVQLIGNFGMTPFRLDGLDYVSVESFWQSLKCSGQSDRRRIAQLSGSEAKRVAKSIPYADCIKYQGQKIPVGSFAHWQLIARACSAKFEQNDEARRALLDTFPHPLEHRLRHDSKTIPGEVMSRIWMGLRQHYRLATE